MTFQMPSRQVQIGCLFMLLFLSSTLFFGTLTHAVEADLSSAAIVQSSGAYRIIGWNDLGMHCMNENFANLCVLPPFNVLWAQAILQGNPPAIVTEGLTVEYRILDNTYSAGKTDFWDFVFPLFNVDLAPNVGLTGATLAGTLDRTSDHFVVHGVPVTPYRDSAPTTWYPYQLAELILRDASTGEELSQTTTVAPVSTEMRCSNCHSDGMREKISTGNVETNILTLHDREEETQLMNERPILCARCHASNALGAPGNPEVPNLSLAMHRRHDPSREDGGTNDCYQCHPGQVTQCLRDVMFAKGITCTDCHGQMAALAVSSREPWVDLPNCGSANCHGAQFAPEPQTLYRNSKGHGGLYCEACHGSPHAILPTLQYNDNIQNIALQGKSGTLRDCTVCHGEQAPAGAGPHGLTFQTPTPTETPDATPTPTATYRPADINEDGAVDAKDLLLLEESWHQP